MTAVGVIGLGNMGRPMVENLLGGGAFDVAVWARSPATVEGIGARVCGTPRELAASSDVILSVLPDLPQLEALLDGADGLRAGGAFTLVICSTSSPEGVRELAERLSPDISVVDAPVSGGVEGARDATLAIMVGGDAGPVATALPVLASMGHPVHLGPLGAGEVAKSCNQMIVAATVMALGEAAVIAERSGIDLEAMFALLGGGYAASRVLETRAERFVRKDYTVAGPARFMVKDLGFALDAARATGTRLRVTPELRAAFEELVAAGWGDSDISATQAYIAGRAS